MPTNVTDKKAYTVRTIEIKLKQNENSFETALFQP